MQIRKQKHLNKKILGLALVLITAIFIGGIVYFINIRNNQSIQTEQKARDEAQTDSSKYVISKKQNIPSNTSNTPSDEVPVADKRSVSISSYSQQNGTVSATAIITGARQQGTCTFLYTTHDAKPVSVQASSVSAEQGFTCSADVSEVEFNKLGKWNLKVTFYSDNTKSEATQDVEIK